MDLNEVNGVTTKHQNTRKRSTKSKAVDNLFIVEDIVDEKFVKGQHFYKVRWKGYSENEDSWEPESNLKNVKAILDQFKNNSNKKYFKIDLTKSLKRSSSASSLINNNNNNSLDSTDFPHDNFKNKSQKAKSRRFEYIPQSEFVASKTKYFDDIRDGKIDLVSNDLYSRVKTRRRTLGTESSTSSLHDEKNDSETENGMTMVSYNSAFSSPPIHSDIDKHFFDVNSNNEEIKLTISEKSADYELVEIYDSHSNDSKISSMLSMNEDQESQRQKYTNKEKDEKDLGTMIDPKPVAMIGVEENQTLDASYDDSQHSKSPLNPSPMEDTEVNGHKTVTDNYSEIMSQYSMLVANTQSIGDLQKLPAYQAKKVKCDSWNDLLRLTTFSPDLLNQITDEDLISLVSKQPDPGSILFHALTAGEGRPKFFQRCLDLRNNPKTFYEIDKLIEHETRLPILHLSVCLNRVYSIKLLLEAGIKINETESISGQYRTPLAFAIYLGNFDLVTFLILNGANFYHVENQTTALKLIHKLLEMHSNCSPVSVGKLPEPPTHKYSTLLNSHNIPGPMEPEGLSVAKIPNFLLIHALFRKPFCTVNSSQAAGKQPSFNDHVKMTNTTQLHSSITDASQLPSVNVLRLMHDFVSIHHAKLTHLTSTIIDQWLFKNNLRRQCTISYSSWISINDEKANMKMFWPLSEFHTQSADAESGCEDFPILLIVHGRILGPGLFNLWLDCTGQCFVKMVIMNGIVQKHLSDDGFAFTVMPQHATKSTDEDVSRCYNVTIEFKNNIANYSSTHCIAPVAISVRFIKPLSNMNKTPTQTAIDQISNNDTS